MGEGEPIVVGTKKDQPREVVAQGRPVNPPRGTFYRDPVAGNIEWDGEHWREPCSGRIIY